MSRREPIRAEIEARTGAVVLEFGAAWCEHCRDLAPGLAALLREFPAVEHIKVEDGPGLPLGRSLSVKLWPTLVFMRAGKVVQQIARPSLDAVRVGLDALTRPTRGEGA